jgi:hypothetical protein
MNLSIDLKHVSTKIAQCLRKDRLIERDSAKLLLGYALLAEESELVGSTRFSRLLVELMLQTI